MLDQDKEAREFIERFRTGEFDEDQLAEALDSLTPEQMENLQRVLKYMPKDLKLPG